MRAVILAAGLGRRLRPLTDTVPKPLLPVGGASILARNLALLASAQVSHVAINLHHHGASIRQAIGDGAAFGMSIRYSEEAELLGTAGGTRQAATLLPPSWPLLVMYGDNLVNLRLDRMLELHARNGGLATLAVHRVPDIRGSGAVSFDASNRIRAFREKPAAQPGQPGWANAGVYLLEQAALEAVPPAGASDFGYDIFPRLLREEQPLFAYCLRQGEDVYPIDTPEKYRLTKAAVSA